MEYWSSDGKTLIDGKFNPGRIVCDDPIDLANGIIAAVCNEFKVSREQIIGQNRRKFIAFPRALAMHRVRKETGLMLAIIGRLFRRDHTTIINACRKISEMTPEHFQTAKEAALEAKGAENWRPKVREYDVREDYKQAAPHFYGFIKELSFDEMKKLYDGLTYKKPNPETPSETLGAAKSVSTFSPTSFGGGG